MDKKIFLVSLLLFSIGSQVLDGVKDARKIFREEEGSALRRKKSLRSVGWENQSSPGPSYLRHAEKATPCPKGTYSYYGEKCLTCKSCTGDHIISLRECRDNQDTECGCVDGYFNKMNLPSLLSCSKCTNCSALGRETLQACERDANGECGSCFSGFCDSEETCMPCPTERPSMMVSNRISLTTRERPSTMVSNRISLTTRERPSMMVSNRISLTTSVIAQSEQCNMVCKLAVGVSGCIFILAGALALYFKKRKMTSVLKAIPPSNIYSSKPHFGSPVSTIPEMILLTDKEPPPSRTLQQGRNLYTVINAVPVRRWKEFVRGLGLQDREIELVELEHSQFREQQYEMLKCWCQQRGASLGAILDALEAMQLGGCAQELTEKLQAEHLWCNP